MIWIQRGGVNRFNIFILPLRFKSCTLMNPSTSPGIMAAPWEPGEQQQSSADGLYHFTLVRPGHFLSVSIVFIGKITNT